MGEMVLTMSTYPGAPPPLGFSLREPLSLAQSFASQGLGRGERAAVGYTREKKKVYLKLKLNSYKILHFVGKSTTT